MELKTLEVKDILGNFSQPREHFDKEKIQELAESILSNGLINPVTVRKDPKRKGKFMLVAGERRTMAHRIAGLKTIPAFVKEYKSDGEWMVESLIENVHREDLQPVEKAKYLKRIKDKLKLNTNAELGNIVGLSKHAVKQQLLLIQDKEITKLVEKGALPSASAQTIMSISNKETAKELAKKIAKKEMGRTELRETVKVINKAPEDIKKALLSDEINVKQAERIAKLKTEAQRKKAIQDHKNISMIDKNVEKNIKQQVKANGKKELDKRLVQAGSWVSSFRGAVTTSNNEVKKTVQVLLLSTKFIPIMDDKQKDNLELDLDRFIQRLEQGLQLAEQIKDKI